MSVAMLTIPLVDGLAKHLSARYSPLFIGWARYAVASLIVLPIAAAFNGRPLFPTERRSSHVWRTVFLVSAMTLYFLSIARIPLATAASAFLIAPVAGVLLAVIVLKERLTLAKVLALILGILGSMVMLRPEGSTDPGILLAIGSGLTFAMYLITMRRASEVSDPIRTLAFQCAVGTALLTPQAVQSWRTPEWSDAWFFLGLGVISSMSHLMSITAFRFAQASTLSPLVYLELVGAALVGYLAFGDIPTASTLAGAAFIVAAGLVLLRAEQASKPHIEARPHPERVPQE
jgi:drug/metabolite transporter (DMT)-like permease